MCTMIPQARWFLLGLSFFVFLLSGCSVSRVGTDEWLAPFRYTVPAAHELRASPLARSFPGSFDEVWEAALLVLARSATVADAQRHSGVIVYFTTLVNPNAVLVEEVGRGNIRVCFDAGRYTGSASQAPPTAATDRTKEAEMFFARLSTQLLAEKHWQAVASKKD